MANSKEKLEIVVSSDNWNDVVSKMAAVGINDKTEVSRRKIKGLFIVEVSLDPVSLADEFYEKIRKHPEIAIISDSASWRRSQAVLEEVYKVETELRKLLLHVYDLVDAYFDVFQNATYAKGLAKHKKVVEPNRTDPLTSNLMLGEMLDVLNFELSWTKRTIGVVELDVLFDSASDLAEVSRRIKNKLAPLRVWDVIAKHVLSQPVPWGTIKDDLCTLKEFRNKAAHFQIITKSEKAKLIQVARRLNTEISKQVPATSAGLMSYLASKEYAEMVANIVSHQQMLADAVKAMTVTSAPALEHLSEQMKQLDAIYRAQIADAARPAQNLAELIRGLQPTNELADGTFKMGKLSAPKPEEEGENKNAKKE